MPENFGRLPPVPSGISGDIGNYLRLIVGQLNSEGYVSIFSGTNPNTSGITGLPGNLLVNIGSASTDSRLFVMSGAARSMDTNAWRVVRVATP